MKCKNCGTILTKTDAHCPTCGQRRPKRRRFPLGLICGVVAGLLVIGILLLTGAMSLPCGKLSTIQYQGNGCGSFDELLNEYIDGLRNLDLARISALYNSDTYADENLITNQVSQIKLEYHPCFGGSFAAPLGRSVESWNKLCRGLLRNYLMVAACRAGQNSWYEIPGYDPGRISVPTSRSEETLQNLINYLNDPGVPQAFSTIQLVRVVAQASDFDTELLQRGRERANAEQYVCCYAEVLIDGQVYPLFVEGLCRNGRWYLANCNYYDGVFPGAAQNYWLGS